jgi:hypothetical protein
MEVKIKSLEELTKAGQLLLMKSPFGGDDIAVYSGKHKTYKYPITTDGRKARSLGYDQKKGFNYVFADDSGDKGDEMIWQYDFLTKMGATVTLDECDDIKTWNFRLIDNTHAEYDEEFAKYGNNFASMLSLVSKSFGDEGPEGGIVGVDESDVSDFMKMIGGGLMGIDPSKKKKKK